MPIKPRGKKREGEVNKKTYHPTRKDHEKVKAMVAYGIPQDKIAAILDIKLRTLRRHFQHEITTAATETDVKAAEILFQQATRGKNPEAAMFWLKCRAGWKETKVFEHSQAPQKKKTCKVWFNECKLHNNTSDEEQAARMGIGLTDYYDLKGGIRGSDANCIKAARYITETYMPCDPQDLKP